LEDKALSARKQKHLARKKTALNEALIDRLNDDLAPAGTPPAAWLNWMCLTTPELKTGEARLDYCRPAVLSRAPDAHSAGTPPRAFEQWLGMGPFGAPMTCCWTPTRGC